jgi:hypothetical protein
MDKKK